MADEMARMQVNSQFPFVHLLPIAIGHVPDIAALRAASPRIVVRAGDTSAGQMPHLAALALADRLGITPVGFPRDPGLRNPSRAVRRHGSQGPPRELTALMGSHHAEMRRPCPYSARPATP